MRENEKFPCDRCGRIFSENKELHKHECKMEEAMNREPSSKLPFSYNTMGEANFPTVMNYDGMLICAGFGGTENVADMRYIVHACNAYPKLVQYLKDHELSSHEAECLLKEIGELT